jgi:MoaA/NifB/PqqE/SkfB family radical SAM enzyme
MGRATSSADVERCRFSVPPTGRSVLWEVTRFCNLECKHCCTYSGPGISTANEVPTDRMIAVAGELAGVDVYDVLFSGGEPFLRPDFLQIIRAIDPARTLVYVASNGTAIHDRTVEVLREARVAGVDVSVDGHTAQLHQLVRLHPTSFQRAVRGIEACVRGDLPLRVTSCVIPETAAHVYELVELMVRLGVKVLVIQSIVPSGGRAVEHPYLAVSRSVIPMVDEQIERAKVRWGDQISIDWRAGESSGGASGCPAGHRLLNISADGDVSTCSWLYKIATERFTLGNIKDRSLKDCLSGVNPMMQPWTAMTPGCPIPEVLRAGKPATNVPA